jgi:hypothetical protein
MPTILQLYRRITTEHDCPWCWACGRDGTYSDMPEDWHAAWHVERAHIVNSPRREDRRLIVLLCSLCHRQSEGIRVVTASRPLDWPVLQVHHLLWLKSRFDPEHFDRHYLQRYSIRRLPRAVEIPAVYLEEYRGRHPE